MVDRGKLVAQLEDQFDCDRGVAEAIAEKATAFVETYEDHNGDALTEREIVEKMADSWNVDPAAKWNWVVDHEGAFLIETEEYKIR